MKARLILIAAAGVLVSTLALAPPAEAGHLDWSFGVGFHVGGLHFQVGFAPTGWGGYPGPFFLTTSPLHHRGYSCNGACFRRGASFYHHASCPLLSFHLRRGGYGPDYFVRHYSPYRGYGRGYVYRPYRPYRPYGYYNRSYGHYYRDGYRDRFRSGRGHHYRDRHHRDRHYRDRYRDDRHRGYRDHRGRGRDVDHDSDSDSDRGRRHYRNDRGSRGGGRDYAQPRRGAQRTRPPR